MSSQRDHLDASGLCSDHLAGDELSPALELRDVALAHRWTQSAAIPHWTRAPEGARTPGGRPAVFRSNTHAWIALRVVYLADVVVQPLCKIAGRTELYRRRWERYLAFLESVRDMCRLVETDITGAAEIWNSVDQTAADAAVSSMLCEREPFPRVNLATMAQRHFGLASRATPDIGVRHRKANDRDHQAAWDVAVDGGCASCGSPTISQHQYDRLTKTMRTHPDLFDLSPTYRQHSGKIAPIWSARLVIAAKGVADHIIPRSQNGPTCADNLANVCAACNYSRNDSSLDDVRVAAYTSPRSGSSLPTVNSG